MNESINNARTGYMGAISTAAYHVDAIWSIFNTMVLANSILAGIIVFLIKEFNSDANPYGLKMFSMLGIILCIAWFLLVYRHVKFVGYYVNSAREIEEQYLFPVHTLSNGGKLTTGETVEVLIKNSNNFQTATGGSDITNAVLSAALTAATAASIAATSAVDAVNAANRALLDANKDISAVNVAVTDVNNATAATFIAAANAANAYANIAENGANTGIHFELDELQKIRNHYIAYFIIISFLVCYFGVLLVYFNK